MLALIVDHGLRAGIRGRGALRLPRGCARAGIASRILAWSGAKPVAGVQAAARAARYRLLEAACRGGASCICCWPISARIRPRPWRCAPPAAAARRPCRHGGGARGAGLRLLRPLLAVPKARLLATLRRCGQPWLDRSEQSRRRVCPRPPAPRTGLRHASVARQAGSSTPAARAADDRRWRLGSPATRGRTRWASCALDRAAWLALAPPMRRPCSAGCSADHRRPRLSAGQARCSARLLGGGVRARAGRSAAASSRAPEECDRRREPGRIRDERCFAPGDEQVGTAGFWCRLPRGGALPSRCGHWAWRGLRRFRHARRRLRRPACRRPRWPRCRRLACRQLVAVPALAAYGLPRPGFSITVAPRPAHPLAGATHSRV